MENTWLQYFVTFLVIAVFVFFGILALWKPILKVTIYFFVPQKISIEGEIVALWEEKAFEFFPSSIPLSNSIEMLYGNGEANSSYPSSVYINRMEYFIKIRNEKEEKILEVSYNIFNKINELKKNDRNLFLQLSCQKYEWESRIEVLDVEVEVSS